jgi:hypothetical protein
MKVTEIKPTCSSFKDYFKKESKKKNTKEKKKSVEQPTEKKDSNFIGWA